MAGVVRDLFVTVTVTFRDHRISSSSASSESFGTSRHHPFFGIPRFLSARYIHMQSGGGSGLWKVARAATVANSFVSRLTHSVAAAKEALTRTTRRRSCDDIDFENTQAIEQRRRLRQAPALLDVFDIWWVTAQRSVTGSSDTSFELDQAGYMAMSRKIQKSMLTDYEEAEATRVAEEDWLSDTCGASSLSREAFYDSLFELADLWTNSVEAEDYAAFLLGLFGCITEGSNDLDITHGAEFVWKADEAISYSGYVLPDSDDDDEQGRLSGHASPTNPCNREEQRNRRRTRELTRRSCEILLEVPPGGSIGAGGVILDASGKPVLGADGKPKRVMDPRVPPGGSIGAGGVILDQKGKPVLGADGKPMRIDTSAGKHRVLSGDECPSLPWLVIVTSPGRRRALGSDDPPSPRDTSRPSLGYQSQTVRSILDVTGKIHDATGGPRPREVLPQSTGKTFPRVPLAQSTGLPLRSRMGARRSPMEPPPPVGWTSAPSSGLPCVSRTCPPGRKFPTGTRGPMAAFSGMPRRPTPLPAKGQGMHSMMRNSVTLPVLAAYASSHGGL